MSLVRIRLTAPFFVLKYAQLTGHQDLLVSTVGITYQFKGFGQHCCDVLFNHAYISW